MLELCLLNQIKQLLNDSEMKLGVSSDNEDEREVYNAFGCSSSSESGLSEMLEQVLVDEGETFGDMVGIS